MKESFNIYHFFAGAFVPFWLLSRQEIGAGAKLAYAALAQQANSRGSVQLHFRVQAAALGADEGKLARHLMELEEVGLIRVSRGNVSPEDVRVFFPPHPWMAGLEQTQQGGAAQAVTADAAAPPRLFPEAATGGAGGGRGSRSRSTLSTSASASSRTRRRCSGTTTSGT